MSAPRTIWLSGDDRRVRAAVLGLIASTPLQNDVDTPARADYRGSITVQAPPYRMSTGLELLWAFANSMAGFGSVHIHELVANLDADSMRAVSHALNVLAGLSDSEVAA